MCMSQFTFSTQGPEKVLLMLISVLRCMIGQLITIFKPSTSNGDGVSTLRDALAEVKKEITTDDDNGQFSLTAYSLTAPRKLRINHQKGWNQGLFYSRSSQRQRE